MFAFTASWLPRFPIEHKHFSGSPFVSPS